MSDEEAASKAWDDLPGSYDTRYQSEAFRFGFHSGLAHERARQSARLRALERVAEAAREWLRHLESHGNSRFQDGLPGELFDAVEALDHPAPIETEPKP